jgi:hypothetical protein
MMLSPAWAEPFDGKWIADIPAQGKCNGTSTMMLLVMDGAIQGQIHNPGNTVPFTGQVESDGTGSIKVNNASEGTIKSSADHFEADWPNRACSRHAEGDRAMDASQQHAAATARKQHQEAFADLVRRANSGEKIDYAALRAEYVYSENWDFYATKQGTLLEQANAAAKGKDCPIVLSKTEQILKMDFILDAAHALRADCLEDRAAARVESDIASGLIHSLMDSGDGETEKTAYVVSTMGEEMDVLANRHIQIKARQTQVRGSDGHYYDEVQGISLRFGGASVKTVYFNIDSFVAGRASKRAATAVAAANLH